ncbi:MAG: VTT domain-containing protein [Candidatus Nanoarchaeia archaeon]|nr:VTT domain-containing protein [Candidatus Nanoarchaeia archaeon]
MVDFNWFITLGYLGAFLASLLGCASFVISLPYAFVLVALSTVLDPFLLSIVSAFGAAIGEFTSYAIGWGVNYSKKKITGEEKDEKPRKGLKRAWYKLVDKTSKWFYKNGFMTIVLFGATPLPDDIVGFIAGATNYSKKKYFLANLIGKLIMSFFIVYSSRFGIEALIDIWAI